MFRRNRFCFEANGLGGPAVADPSVSDAPAGDPAAPAEPAAWAPPGQEWYEQTEQTQQAILEYVQQQQQAQLAAQQAYFGQGQQQEQGPPRPSPFDDDWDEKLDAYIESKLAPFQQTQEQIVYGEAEELALDILNDIVKSQGDLLLPDSVKRARQLADSYVQEEQAKYGFGERAAEAALERAYNDVKAWEQAVGKAYHERQMNQLSTLSLAPREPNAPIQAAQEQVYKTGGNELDLVRKYGGTVL